MSKRKKSAPFKKRIQWDIRQLELIEGFEASKKASGLTFEEIEVGFKAMFAAAKPKPTSATGFKPSKRA